MNYLFFDIECAAIVNGVSRICSFGYYLCDENYSLIEKKDIVIDPRCEFDTQHFRIGGIKFAYDEAYFFRSPTFREVYPEIRRLLTLPDTVICGHATSCDASYLLQNIHELGLSDFDFMYLDTQKLHQSTGEPPFMALETLCKYYRIVPLRKHKSDDDAEMTALVAKAVCEKGGITLKNAYRDPKLLGCVHNGELHTSLSSAFPIGDNGSMTPAAKRLIRRYLGSQLKRFIPDEDFFGVKYTFCEGFEQNELPTALWLIHQLRLRGAIYTTNVLDCNIFVDFPSKHTDAGRMAMAKGAHKRIIDSDALINRLGLKIPKSSEIDTDSIFGEAIFGREWYEYYHSVLSEKLEKNRNILDK